MGQIIDSIKEHEPDRVRAYCGVCGTEFFDSVKKGRIDSLHRLEAELSVAAEKHRNETMTSHDDLQVDLDIPTGAEREIEATINVQ